MYWEFFPLYHPILPVITQTNFSKNPSAKESIFVNAPLHLLRACFAVQLKTACRLPVVWWPHMNSAPLGEDEAMWAFRASRCDPLHAYSDCNKEMGSKNQVTDVSVVQTGAGMYRYDWVCVHACSQPGHGRCDAIYWCLKSFHFIMTQS